MMRMRATSHRLVWVATTALCTRFANSVGRRPRGQDGGSTVLSGTVQIYTPVWHTTSRSDFVAQQSHSPLMAWLLVAARLDRRSGENVRSASSVEANTTSQLRTFKFKERSRERSL